MIKNPTREQQQIIQTTEGYLRCGAVPGSGKTYCITNRMAYLITELYVDPSSIVALTFTNKAAASMTHRLKMMIGDEAACFTGPFHGYCNNILKEEIYRLSYPRAFTMKYCIRDSGEALLSEWMKSRRLMKSNSKLLNSQGGFSSGQI